MNLVKIKEVENRNDTYQGSPTILKLPATSCRPIYVKGYKFDIHFWNKNFAQFTFNYFSIDIR